MARKKKTETAVEQVETNTVSNEDNTESTLTSTEVENTNKTPSLNVDDLRNVLKVVDVAAERGAFKGNELSTVGTIRDKIQAFLDSIPTEDTVANETENNN